MPPDWPNWDTAATDKFDRVVQKQAPLPVTDLGWTLPLFSPCDHDALMRLWRDADVP